MSESATGLACVKMDGPALFFRNDVRQLLHNKKIIFVGDSNMRTVYKDVVVLVEAERLCHVEEFQRRVVGDKLEATFMGDSLIRGSHTSNARDFEEVRHYAKHGVDLTYAFVTKCWPNYFLKDLFEKIEKDETRKPDMVIMCSMLWDVSRCGPDGVEVFKKSLNELCVELKDRLNPGTFLWVTNPPVGSQVTAAFLLEELGFLSHLMRFHVKEANAFSMDVMENHGVGGFDMHYYMSDLIDLRDPDAIHWTPSGVRLMTNLILTHLCLLWGVQPPKFGKHQYELVKDINYEYLMKSLAGLVRNNCTPRWLEAMFQKEPRLREHVEYVGRSSNGGLLEARTGGGRVGMGRYGGGILF